MVKSGKVTHRWYKQYLGFPATKENNLDFYNFCFTEEDQPRYYAKIGEKPIEISKDTYMELNDRGYSRDAVMTSSVVARGKEAMTVETYVDSYIIRVTITIPRSGIIQIRHSSKQSQEVLDVHGIDIRRFIYAKFGISCSKCSYTKRERRES